MRLGGTLRAGLSDYAVSPGEIVAIEEGDRPLLGEVVARECSRVKDPALLAQCPGVVERYVRQEATDARARADASVRSLRALVGALASFDGAKHVVLVAGVIPQFLGVTTRWKALAADASAARVLVHSLPTQQRTNFVIDTERPGLAVNPTWNALTNAPSAATSLAVMTGGLNNTAEVPDARSPASIASWPESTCWRSRRRQATGMARRMPSRCA